MTRLQCPHVGRDAEQPAKEILDMWRQIDNEVRLGRMLEPVRIAPCRHQPLMQPGIDFREMANKRPIDPRETAAIIEIGETEAMRENEIGHIG